MPQLRIEFLFDPPLCSVQCFGPPYPSSAVDDSPLVKAAFPANTYEKRFCNNARLEWMSGGYQTFGPGSRTSVRSPRP